MDILNTPDWRTTKSTLPIKIGSAQGFSGSLSRLRNRKPWKSRFIEEMKDWTFSKEETTIVIEIRTIINIVTS